MVRNRSPQLRLLAILLMTGVFAHAEAAEVPASCSVAGDSCVQSCTRFDVGDVRRTACHNYCAKLATPCKQAIPQALAAPAVEPAPAKATTAASESPPVDATPSASPESKTADENKALDAPVSERSDSEKSVSAESPATQSAPAAVEKPSTVEAGTPVDASPACKDPCEPPKAEVNATSTETPPAIEESRGKLPTVPMLTTKSAVVREHDQNLELLAAIRAGNLKVIRRLIESQGLDPTYVFAHEFNQHTRQYDGRVLGFRLTDVLNDASTLRTGGVGLDAVLSLFLELGMDVKATLPAKVLAESNSKLAASGPDRTAWGPNLRMMEKTPDRAARVQAFDIALQAGLVPNEDFGAWLFAELPQVCGRDRSKFSIQIVDLLIKHLKPVLGPQFEDSFWRMGERGPETISDVLDRSFAPGGPKNSYEKEQFAIQDDIWEQCASLSRRINRLLIQGK